jgi:hypothetical protein
MVSIFVSGARTNRCTIEWREQIAFSTALIALGQVCRLA